MWIEDVICDLSIGLRGFAKIEGRHMRFCNGFRSNVRIITFENRIFVTEQQSISHPPAALKICGLFGPLNLI